MEDRLLLARLFRDDLLLNSELEVDGRLIGKEGRFGMLCLGNASTLPLEEIGLDSKAASKSPAKIKFSILDFLGGIFFHPVSSVPALDNLESSADRTVTTSYVFEFPPLVRDGPEIWKRMRGGSESGSVRAPARELVSVDSLLKALKMSRTIRGPAEPFRE